MTHRPHHREGLLYSRVMGLTAPVHARSWPPGLRRNGLWGMLVGTLVGAVTGASCTFPIDGHIACGDGYVDVEAGEDCDPAVLQSYANACVGTTRPAGDADCDPSTCTIINTKEQCAVCGDGIVDEDLGEQCDGDNLDGEVCPGGVGTLRCGDDCRFDQTYCKQCGNGVRDTDAGEECDPNADPSEVIADKPMCSTLESPYVGRPYTSGQPSSCLDDCRWDRAGCGYCGNDRIEDAGFVVDFEGTPATPELCDGDWFDEEAREGLTSAACPAGDDLRPVVTACSSDCKDFVFDPQECCIKKGALCPEQNAPVRCCYEHEEGESPEDSCENKLEGAVLSLVCR